MSDALERLEVYVNNPAAAISLEELQQLIPTDAESQRAAAEAAGDPTEAVSLKGRLATSGADVAEAARKRLEKSIAEADDPREVSTLSEFDASMRQAALQTAVATGVGIATGGATVPVRIGAQVLAGGGTDFIHQLLEGQSATDAAASALETGGIAGAAEGAIPGAAGLVGGTVRGIRSLARGTRDAVRATRGVRPLPRIPRIESSRAPMENFLEEGAEEALEVVESLGGVPLAGQLVEHNLIDTAQNIASAAITGGQSIRAQGRMNVDLVRNALKAAVDRFPTMSRKDVSTLISDLVEGRLHRIKGQAGGLFRAVDRRLGTAESVDIRSLKKFAERESKAASKGLGNPRIVALWNTIKGKNDRVSYAEASRIRSDLFEESQQFNPENLRVMSQSQRVASRGASFVTRSINEAVRKHDDPAVRQMLNEARRLWRTEVKGELTNRVITTLVKKQPEDMLDALIRTGRPGDIRIVRDIVMKEDPNVWLSVQGAFLRRAMAATSDVRIENGEKILLPNGKKFLESVVRFGREDDAAMRALFPDGPMGSVQTRAQLNYRDVLRLGQTLHLMQKGAGGTTTGAVWFNLQQAAAFGTAVGFAMNFAGGDPGVSATTGAGVAAAFILTPWAFARALRNPEFTRWMTIGAKATPGSRPATRAALVLTGNLVRNNLLDEGQTALALQFINRLRGATAADPEGTKP